MSPVRLPELVTAMFRVVVGLLFALHGAATLFGAFGGHRGSGAAAEIGAWPSWYAAVIQFVGGLLVLTGLGTRIAALICSGSMAYAYFVVHQPTGLLPQNNGGELSALFCWSFLLIAAIGAGRYSLDALLSRRRSVQLAPEPATV
ncbi:DoxX family protein [Solwaraspora sp. WMMD406]|uniref:DoxX family protein n=1 Tax=Solwaraspora sp. WMMD406 TaxID=3016095 RepID=UPI002418107E|nr:DoxX family protein [Solwaraspora sp. WMMD406]MDG4768602.1 DoxX family protein [Solwaraspora sp. WMMD406]